MQFCLPLYEFVFYLRDMYSIIFESGLIVLWVMCTTSVQLLSPPLCSSALFFTANIAQAVGFFGIESIKKLKEFLNHSSN